MAEIKRKRGRPKGSKDKKKRKKAIRKTNIDDVLAFSQKHFDKRVEELEAKQLAEGIAIHSIVNRRTSSNLLSDVNDYSDSTLDDRNAVVALARKLRRSEGICASVADLWVDFAATKGSFYSDNIKLKDLLNRWADFVNLPTETNIKGVVFPVSGLRAVVRKIIDDYLTDGDSVFTFNWKKNVKMDENIDKKALFLPVTLRSIDTTTLEINDELAKFGVEQITLELSTDIKKRLLDPKSDADKFLVKSVPKEWISKLNKKEDIILDPKVTFHISRNGKDYRAWGESIFTKAFTAIANKRRIQAVDAATIDGLINRFTIFKLGLPDKEKNPAYHIPTPARVQALINIITDPKRTNACVWPGPDLSVEDIGPDGKILEFTDKYKQVDIDILRALHTSPLLIDGTSSINMAKDFISFLGVEIGLDYIRGELEQIFTIIGKEIAFNNKMKYKEVKYNLESQMLKDEKRVRNFALKMYELGGISIETFVEKMGYDFDVERNLKEREIADGLDEIFINRSAPGFTGPQKDTVEPEGRPEDTKEEDKIGASLKNNVEFYYNVYRSIFDDIKLDLENKASISITMVNLSLVAGFSKFRQLVETQLKETFRKNIGNIHGYMNELSYLLEWNEFYINRFYNTLNEQLNSSYEDINLFKDVLNKVDYRLRLYAQESYKKAVFISDVVKYKKSGYTKAYWSKINCKEAEDKKEKEFSLDEIMRLYPCHPNCDCEIGFRKD